MDDLLEMQPDRFKKLIRWGLFAWGLCQPISIAGANIATGIILAGLVGYGLSSRSFPSLRSPLEKPLLIYLAAAVLACMFAQDPRESFRHMNSEAHKVALFFLFSAAFAVESSPAVLGWWAAGILTTAAIGLLQVAGWHALGVVDSNAGPYFKWCEVPHFWQWIWFSDRAHGTINAVTYGEILGMALVGGVCFAAVRRRQGVPIGRFPLAFCALAGLAWVLSGTRGAWLGAFVSLGLLRVLLAPRRAALELTGAFLAAGVLGLLAGQLRSSGPLDLQSFTCRLELWDVAARMFRDHPIFGVGIHNFGAMFPKYHSVPFLWQQTWGDPHNLWLAQLAERGLVGFLALCLLLGAMIQQSWARFRRSGSFLSLWCLTWLVGFLVMNLTESAFQVAMVWMPTMVLCAWMERSEDKLSPSDLKV